MASPITRRGDHASFDEASRAILRILSDGEWHKSTAEIHEPLRPWIAEHMFGKVKDHYRIEHRRVGGGPGSYYEWRLPPIHEDPLWDSAGMAEGSPTASMSVNEVVYGPKRAE